MSQSDEAWNEVGEQFKKLGSTFKHHYQAHDDSQKSVVPSDSDVKDALATLGESVKQAFGAVGDTLSDPEIKEETRQTAGMFFDALGTTFSEFGDDISGHRSTEQDYENRPDSDASDPDEHE